MYKAAIQPDVLAQLRCPICRRPLGEAGGGLRCGAGHTFDRARQGYFNLRVDSGGVEGDSAAMVAARAAVLGAGHFQPLAHALARLACDRISAPGLVVEVGAGTAYYLASVLGRLPSRGGLALDLSKYAARRAARAHPQITAAVADVRASLPLADGAAALVLDVFAPRHGAELRRILHSQGLLLVATPEPHHLAELREPLGLLEVDPDKDRRVMDNLAPHLVPDAPMPVGWTMQLPRREVQQLVAMGPSARHLDPAALASRVAALPEPTLVTAAVAVTPWRPRG